MAEQRRYRIACIPGDGIGKEVLPEGVRALEAAGAAHGFETTFDDFAFSSAEFYTEHGAMLPDDWQEVLSPYDAILFGAVGWPETIPDHVSLWGSLLQFRRHFEQYVCLRPVRLMPGVTSPLRDPGEIDFVIVRENSEGEYSEVGGTMFAGTEREVVNQGTVMTRVGVDRIVRYAFDLAARREARHLTSATKSNGIAISMPYWDTRVEAIAAEHAGAGLTVDKFHIDNLVAQLVLRPAFFDVVVGSNLFGDILSDLGPALTGALGIAPSANINPEREHPSLFEPVHGSAPDIAGQAIANPVGMIWAAQMLLEHLGETAAAAAVMTAIEGALADPATRTRDLGGSADTRACGEAVAAAIG